MMEAAALVIAAVIVFGLLCWRRTA